MPAPSFMKFIAGEALHTALADEREAAVEKARANGAYRTDDELCYVQEQQARRGILGAKLVETIYGWSVRYDSGLQDFGLIASVRHGNLDGSYAAAVAFAEAWVAEDPSRRYAWQHVRG